MVLSWLGIRMLQLVSGGQGHGSTFRKKNSFEYYPFYFIQNYLKNTHPFEANTVALLIVR